MEKDLATPTASKLSILSWIKDRWKVVRYLTSVLISARIVNKYGREFFETPNLRLSASSEAFVLADGMLVLKAKVIHEQPIIVDNSIVYVTQDRNDDRQLSFSFIEFIPTAPGTGHFPFYNAKSAVLVQTSLTDTNVIQQHSIRF